MVKLRLKVCVYESVCMCVRVLIRVLLLVCLETPLYI